MYSTTGYTMNKAYQIILLSYITIPVLMIDFSFPRTNATKTGLTTESVSSRTTGVVYSTVLN